jgi:hypothetical protein
MLTVTPATWATWALAAAALLAGSAWAVDVEVAGSEIEPRESLTVRDEYFDFKNLTILRFISLIEQWVVVSDKNARLSIT